MKPKAHWSFKVVPQDFDSDRVLLDAEAAGLEVVVVRIGKDCESRDRYRIAVREGTVASRADQSELSFECSRLVYSLNTGNFYRSPYIAGETRPKWRWNYTDLLKDSVDKFLSAVNDQREKEQRRVRFAVRGYGSEVVS